MSSTTEERLMVSFQFIAVLKEFGCCVTTQKHSEHEEWKVSAQGARIKNLLTCMLNILNTLVDGFHFP